MVCLVALVESATTNVDRVLRASTRALTTTLPNSVSWLLGICSVSSRSRAGAGFHSADAASTWYATADPPQGSGEFRRWGSDTRPCAGGTDRAGSVECTQRAGGYSAGPAGGGRWLGRRAAPGPGRGPRAAGAGSAGGRRWLGPAAGAGRRCY